MMMVGDGAYRFAVKRGLPAASRKHIHEHRITVGNVAKWMRFRAMIDGTYVDDQGTTHHEPSSEGAHANDV